jgi:hypothetical protein
VAIRKLPVVLAAALLSNNSKSSPPPVAVPAAVPLMKESLITLLVTPLKMKMTTDLPELVQMAALLAVLLLVLSQQLLLLPCLAAILQVVKVGNVVLSAVLVLTLIANTLMTLLNGAKDPLQIRFFAMLAALAGFETVP